MMNIIYATCHLFGMSSACANPFLYGWFNDNFRGEFKLIFAAPYRLFCPARATSDGDERRLRHCNSSATAFTLVPDTMLTQGQIKPRRIAKTIDTSIDEKKKRIKKNSAIELEQQSTATVKEIIVIIDRQNVVETQLISRSTSLAQTEGQSSIDRNTYSPVARSDEIDDKTMPMLPIFPSSTLETHF